MPYTEGQTASGPDGSKLVFKDGGWQPLVTPQVEPESISTAQDIKQTALPSAARGVAGFLSGPRGMYDLATSMIGKGADAVLPEGAAAGVRKTLQNAPDSPVKWLNPAMLPFLMAPKYDTVMEHARKLTGKPLDYEAQTPLGKVAQTAIEYAPAALTGPGGLGPKLAKGAGAVVGTEALGQGAAEAWPEAESVARLAGTVLGSGIPTAVRRGITPLPASPQQREIADVARAGGVNLTAGQSTGNKFVQGLEGANIDSIAAPARFQPAAQAAQYTRGALREGSVNTPNAAAGTARTREITGQSRATGQELDNVYNRNMLNYDQQMLRELSAARTAAGRNTDVIDPYLQRIAHGPTTGATTPTSGVGSYLGMQGSTARELERELLNEAKIVGRGARPDERQSGALRDAYRAVRGAMDRSVNTGPDAGRLPVIREQYTNLKALEDASMRSGQKSARGTLNPGDVYQALTKSPNPVAHDNTLGRFSRATEALGIGKPMKGIDLKERAGATALGTLLGGGGGYYSGGHENAGVQSTEAGILGAITGGALLNLALKNPAMARTLFRPGTQQWLANQRFHPTPATQMDPQLVARLLMSAPPHDGAQEAE